MKPSFKTIPLLLATIFLFTNLSAAQLFGNSAGRKSMETAEDSIESLYHRYLEYYTTREYQKAGEAIERMLEIEEGGIENILKTPGDEYPDYILNLIFDYGICLIQQERWEEARNCYRYCVDSYPLPKKFIP